MNASPTRLAAPPPLQTNAPAGARRRYLGVRSGDQRAWYDRGCCRLLLGRGQDALEDFDRALSLLGVPERLQNTDVPCTRMHSK